MIAGPSEVLILADADNDPDWLALDLLAQAEHDAAAQAILITDDAGFGRAVAAAVEARLATLARRAIAGASWRDHGAVITVADWSEAIALSDRIAPEHLQICTAGRRGARRPRPPRRRHLHRRASPPRRSATTSAARTTCCRPHARRASPPASRCSTS